MLGKNTNSLHKKRMWVNMFEPLSICSKNSRAVVLNLLNAMTL